MLFRALVELYSWFLPRRLVTELENRKYSVSAYLGWFWHARRYEPSTAKLSDKGRLLEVIALLGSLVQIVFGVWLLTRWAQSGAVGEWQFGLALLVSYPIVWTHVLAALAIIGWALYFLFHPKKFGRTLVCVILERQVKQLKKRHSFKTVAVVGSVGKTSTKLAIANLLGGQLRVQHQSGNYNDRVTVPLIFFGQTEPNLINIFGWLKIFGANSRMIHEAYPYDVVVVELGVDGPGQMRHFAYTKPDLAVVTAVSPEHMEYFKTLDAVAAEELAIFDFADEVLVNGDDIPGEYLASRSFVEYSTISDRADYYTNSPSAALSGQTLSVKLPSGSLQAKTSYIGQHGAKIVLAAVAVGDILGMKPKQIENGIELLAPFAGRMQILLGTKDSTLIDDTYNASPMAVKAALDVLYANTAKQRIAILGNMNELGDYSQEAHQEIGDYCDAKKLDLVVTIGTDANKYLAPAAKKQGCVVKTFTSPYEAGEFVASKLQSGAIVLAKGSQNGVFAEEALKPLLQNADDQTKLVRQSPYWIKQKQQQFND
ncbi:MAG: Mur ligase family protein [Candidatus Saccharimonadales bacterium]